MDIFGFEPSSPIHDCVHLALLKDRKRCHLNLAESEVALAVIIVCEDIGSLCNRFCISRLVQLVPASVAIGSLADCHQLLQLIKLGLVNLECVNSATAIINLGAHKLALTCLSSDHFARMMIVH